MEIRRATVEDVPGVLPLVAAVCAFHQELDPDKYGFVESPESRYARWLPDRAADPRSVFLVAEVRGRIVAFVVGTVERELPVYKLKEFGFIHDLWVEPDYRNEGLGRQLTLLAVESFTAMGIEQVRLDTAWRNDAARDLFVSCGFRASTVEMIVKT